MVAIPSNLILPCTSPCNNRVKRKCSPLGGHFVFGRLSHGGSRPAAYGGSEGRLWRERWSHRAAGGHTCACLSGVTASATPGVASSAPGLPGFPFVFCHP